MARNPNQKTKLLRLAQLLLERTDEEHPLTVPQIIGELGRYDIHAERKSIYDDLETLSRVGLDVQCRKGKAPGWFIGARDFELPELKLLVDAVQSSRFITRRKSGVLIRKLERLASVYQAGQLQRQVYVSGRVKAMNESIYYNVDKLHTALAGRRSVTFQYFDYDMFRQKVFRHGGALYAVSPFALIWNSGNYYLVAFDHARRELRHFRVDKMSSLTVTAHRRQGEDLYPGFDPAEYDRLHFGMFTGEEMQVVLRGESSKAGVVWDRFGGDIILVPDGPDHFTVTLPVVLSPQFFGWLFGLGGTVSLAGPEAAVNAYRQSLEAALRDAGQSAPL